MSARGGHSDAGAASRLSARLAGAAATGGFPSLPALKWIALVAMVADHVDRHLAAGALGWSPTVGRLAMPLFVFVLAANLVGSSPADAAGMPALRRTALRMLVAGAAAVVPTWIMMGRQWWPQNIMFALALCVAITAACRWVFLPARESLAGLQGGTGARVWHVAERLMGSPGRLAALAALAIAAGVLATGLEYHWWLPILYGACAWWLRRPGACSAAALVLALAALYPFQSSWWPLLCAPLIMLAARHARRPDARPGGEHVMTPARWVRLRFFYLFYPLHLWAIVLLGGIVH